MASLFLHAAQTTPLRVPHLSKPAHRTRNTVRLRTERANKARAERVRYPFDDHRPARLAQLVQHRFRRGRRLGGRFGDGFHRRSFYRSLHGARPASRGTCRSCSCRSHGCRFLPAGKVPPAGFCVVSRSTLGALVQDRAPSQKSPLSSVPQSRLLPPLDDHAIGALVPARLLAESREGPWRLRVIALDAAFAPAVRVIDRVHRHAANRRANAPPARASGFAEGFILVVEIADLADGGFAIEREFANFARRHFHQREIAFLA